VEDLADMALYSKLILNVVALGITNNLPDFVTLLQLKKH
jgi:hypothetical protein